MKGLKLPITVEPHPDESLRSLMLRLAEANGYRDVIWVRELAGTSKSKLPANRVHERDLPGLSWISGLPESQLRSMGWWSVLRRDGEGVCDEARMGEVSVPDNLTNLARPKICPQCLIEQNYAKAMWEATSVCVCPSHGLVLVDRCPDCNEYLVWRRPGVSHCRCGCDFRIPGGKRASDEAIELHRIIFASMPSIKQEQGLFRCGFPIYDLLRLSYVEIQEILMYLGNFYAELGTPCMTLRRAKPRVEVVYRAQQAIAELLSQWPVNFRNGVNKLIDIARDDAEPTAPALRQLESLERFLGRNALDVRFDFMRKEFVDLYANLGKARVESRARLYADHETWRGVMTIQEAAIQIRMSLHAVRDLLKRGVLTAGPGGACIHKWKARQVVSRESVRYFLEERKNKFVDALGAAQLLGISLRYFRELQNEAVFGTARIRGGGKYWTYERQQFDSLLEAIHRHMVPDDDCSSNERVSITHVLQRQLGRDKIRIEFFGALRSGQIHAVRKDAAKAGLSGLYVHRTDIKIFMRRALYDKARLLPSNEAAAQLGIDPRTMRYLLKGGFLKTTKFSWYRGVSFVVEGELEKIKHSCTTTARLAHLLGAPPITVASTLDALGVKPLFRARSRLSSYGLYRHSDVNAVNLGGTIMRKYGSVEGQAEARESP